MKNIKTFRGKETNGWKIVSARNGEGLERKLNYLMELYDFEDLQFSVDRSGYHLGGFHAAILLGKKKEIPKMTNEEKERLQKTFEIMKRKAKGENE